MIMNDTVKFISNSPEDTYNFAVSLAKSAKGGQVYAFFGGLGMGKTAFTKGFAAGLGYSGEVSSPTFALVHEYRGGRLNLFHFDMYRVESWDDLYSTGFFDYLDENGVLAVEWSENIENALPEDAVRITIERGESDESRIITVVY